MRMWKRKGTLTVAELLLREGYIISVRTRGSFTGWVVREVLRCEYEHDGIVVNDLAKGWCSGDSHLGWFGARLTPVSKLVKKVNRGKVILRVAAVPVVPMCAGSLAADWWRENIKGTLYDVKIFWIAGRLGVARLFTRSRNWKRVRARLTANIKDFEQWYWCTEGVAAAWREGAKRDVYTGFKHATPASTDALINSSELVVRGFKQ